MILFSFLLKLSRLKYLHFILTLNEATLVVRGGKTKVLFFVVLDIGRCRARGQWNDLFTVPLLVQPPPCILRHVPYVLSSAGRSSVRKTTCCNNNIAPEHDVMCCLCCRAQTQFVCDTVPELSIV